MDAATEAPDAQSANAPDVLNATIHDNSTAIPSIETPSAADVDMPTVTESATPMSTRNPTPAQQSRKSTPQVTATESTGNAPGINAPTMAAPYGTRSRNRTGASRPNYAEDKEVEAEFDTPPAKKEANPRKRKGGTASRSGTVEPTAPSSNAKSTTVPAADSNGTAHPLRKEHVATTSAPSAKPSTNSSPQPNKKRKVNGQHTPAVVNGALAPAKKDILPIPPINLYETSSAMLTYENTKAYLQDGKLIADDGTVLAVNDHAYMVCEPPGDPYYLGRIMEFLHVEDDKSKPVEALRMNWYYRPRDIQKHSLDRRQLFATFNSDVSPISCLRGACTIKHKSEVEDMDEFRKQQNCFWYDKFYDRYIMRLYDVIPTKLVVNVPAKVKKVLDERWEYILVEPQVGKELTNASKSCKRCNGFCATASSVDCAICHKTYHMQCVQPPLTKKPSRGFGWQCGPCSRALSRKADGNDTPNTANDEEIEDEDEEMLNPEMNGDTGTTTPAASDDMDIHVGTADQIHQCSLWPFRYLGQHCKVEDCLDYDDRIWPRTFTRLGPKFQANVPAWAGRPVELVKPPPVKKKRGNAKNNGKLSKEAQAALEAEKLARENRPKWIEDEPVGYVARGEDYDNNDPRCTAELLYKPLESSDIVELEQRDKTINEFVAKTEDIAKKIGVLPFSTNILTTAITILHATNYDIDASLAKLSKLTKKDLKEPDLSAEELKKFEQAVAKFGSQLLDVRRHVKTVAPGTIVRFYYTWKKTERGKQIWQNYFGRKGKKEAKKQNAVKLQDEYADELDDSAFDNEKAAKKKKSFHCKFCSTRTSRQWRRAPNTAPGTTVNVDSNGKVTAKEKGMTQLLVALCMNCATVWRKYGVQWEDTEDTKKGVPTTKAKRKAADDPLREFQLSEMSWTASNTEAVNTPLSGSPVRQLAPPVASLPEIVAHPRKKQKIMAEKAEKADKVDKVEKAEKVEKVEKPERTELPTMPSIEPHVAAAPVKKKPAAKPLPPPPPPEPVMPKPKTLPCAVCSQLEPKSDHVSCYVCRMSVHKKCYGVLERKPNGKWMCDTCSNDKKPVALLRPKCVLCPVSETHQDFVEPAKISHKKKTEKEREKDRQDKELAQKAEDFYKQRQTELGRPIIPREALKRTTGYKWAHVTCAVWTPEIRFGEAERLEPVEGIPLIPVSRSKEICKVCRAAGGRCVSCHSCKAPMHVECARQAGYVLGFDITPVKGSRRDQANLVTINGETGTMTAAIWCKEHVPTKTIVHRMHEVVDEQGTTALQLYAKTFKQADLSMTGAMRKAAEVKIVSVFDAMPVAPPAGTSNRRSSTIAALNAQKAASAKAAEQANAAAAAAKSMGGPCSKCKIDVSPRWYPISTPESRSILNGVGSAEVAERLTVESKPVQCHKCYRASLKAKVEHSPSQPALASLPAARTEVPIPLEPAQIPADKYTAGFPPAQVVEPPRLSGPYPAAAQPTDWKIERDRGVKERSEILERMERERRLSGPPMPQPAQNGPGQYRPPMSLPPYMGPPPLANPPPPRFVGPVVSHAQNSPHVHRPSAAVVGSPSMYYPRPSSPHRPPVLYRPASPPMSHAPVPPPQLHQPPGHYPPPPSSFQQQQQHSPYYAAARVPPHHLTNGGPPPRPMDNPYSRPPPYAHEHPYRPSPGYPNIMRDDYRDPREQRDGRDVRDGRDPREIRDARDPRDVNGVVSTNNVNVIVGAPGQPVSTPTMGSATQRTANTDNRVNGGASASPNLRNLLS